MKSRIALAVALFGAILQPSAHATLSAQDPKGEPAPGQESEDVAEPGLAPAEPAELERLLAAHAAAESEEDAVRVAVALREMAPYSNEELFDVAKDALRYRASRVDRDAADAEAEELGLTSKKEREAILAQRVAEVHAAASRLLGNFPEDGGRLLHRQLRSKDVRKGEPAVLAAVIDGLGRARYEKAERDVIGEFGRYGDKEVLRACVRFFGQLPTKDKGVVRVLCETLDPPEPADVNSPSNPPASYWAARWEKWNFIRRDVTWALKQITGQVFKPAEGEHKSDSRKALAYIKEHERELGLK